MSNWITEAREAHQGISRPPEGIREFLHALQARNEKDNGLFPQAASEVEADAKALRRVLAVLDFYHPPRASGVKASPPAQRVDDFIAGVSWKQANPDASLDDMQAAAEWWASLAEKADAQDRADGVDLPDGVQR